MESTGRLPPRVLLGLVLFAALRFVLEEESQGGEAEQEGLEEPEAACGHVVDAFVTGGTHKKTQPLNDCGDASWASTPDASAAGMTWWCFGNYLHTFRETKASTAWIAKAAHHLQQRHTTTLTVFHTKQLICGHFCVWTAGSNTNRVRFPDKHHHPHSQSVSQPVPAASAHWFINTIERWVRLADLLWRTFVCYVCQLCVACRTSPPLV